MSFDFAEWWATLTLVQQIYWGIAIPSTVIFILQTILTFMGGEIEANIDHDLTIETDHGVGFQFLTFKNFIAFFTMFSWTGIVSISSGISTMTSVVIAVSAGLAMMVLMASLFYYFSRLTDSGTMHMKNAIGKIGEVYLTVGANRANIGKVSIKVQGGLRELEALTDDETDLTMGTVIEVKDIINDNLLLITKSKK